ncbi:Fic/DOC family protein [Fluviicola sp.]|uniref:Fic/DOC family protein n=1 Tax=Fluviicola sp. TaxID=1917219 RepID=UPI003D2D5D3A
MKAGDKYKVPSSEQEGKVLPNKLNITDLHEMELAEAKGFISAQILLRSELNSETIFDLNYILKIHKLALGDIYSFAGKARRVDMSKAGFRFPSAFYLENTLKEFDNTILKEIRNEYQDTSELIEDISKVHAELLFIHPFREGNGRTARVLANLMAEKAGYDRLLFERLDNTEMFAKYIQAIQQAAVNYEPMREIIGLSFSNLEAADSAIL